MYRQYSYYWLLALTVILIDIAGARCAELPGNRIESVESKAEQSLCIEQYGEVGNESFTYR